MNVDNLFKKFQEQRILVLGDVMIDAYLRGSVDRVSPEAPVPIVNLRKSEERLGGAANVALNLLAMGAKPILCAFVGDDSGGNTFSWLLQKRGMSTDGILKSKDRTTIIKTRVIGNNQHLLRIDEEQIEVLTTQEEVLLIEKVSKIIESGLDAIILEDYNKGLLTPTVIRSVINLAREKNIPVSVDPKKDNFFEYEGVTLFKPNLKELKEGLGVSFDIVSQRPSFEAAVCKLEERLKNEISFITLSEYGVFIRSEETNHYIPAHLRKISDVSGAGDTVIAVATLCLATNVSVEMLADISNLAGGLVCEVSGVVPIDKEMLRTEVLKLVEA
ncbi:MAG: bifunctional ADP-heptose synthase [Crocinitomicaceae bacterium]|nr:bifunctional ADP-heptose synthase [Crocinitomicaceae bacterium]